MALPSDEQAASAKGHTAETGGCCTALNRLLDLPGLIAEHAPHGTLTQVLASYVVEFTGALMLTLVVSLTAHVDVAPLPIGAILVSMIFMGGHISGGHYNPAVSVAVYVRGKIGILRAFFYTAAQVAGALCAARIGEVVLGADSLPLPMPNEANGISDGHAFLVEFLFTYALAATVLNTATTVSVGDNSFYGLAIGFVVLAGGFSAGDISGAAFNPAVASGLYAVAGTNRKLWIYWLGPLAGGAAAGLLFHLINSDENDLRLGKSNEIERRGAAVGGQTASYRQEVASNYVWLRAMKEATAVITGTDADAVGDEFTHKDIVKKSFEQFDHDHDGKITASEMIEILQEQGVSEDQARAMVNAVDANNDGTVTFAEYEQMMLKVAQAAEPAPDSMRSATAREEA